MVALHCVASGEFSPTLLRGAGRVYIYIYIYIYSERYGERSMEGETERQRELVDNIRGMEGGHTDTAK